MRVSFSKSVCEYLAARVEGCRVRPARLQAGPVLAPGETSPTGLYVLAKARSGWPLRVTLFQDLAEHWRDPSRVVRVGRLNVAGGLGL